MSETPRQTLERMDAARDFPRQTCAASRHVALLAEELVYSGFAPSIQDEPAHCGQSMASVVASLWESRAALAAKDAEIERLRAGIRKVIEEGAPRKVAKPYAKDGRPHKGDRCPHDAFTWDSCDACTDEYLAALLEGRTQAQDNQ